MRVESARYEGGELILSTHDPEARRLAYQFKAGDYELIKAKKKRSLDANAYAWVLIDKLAEFIRIPKEEIYRNAIRNIGGVSDVVCVRDDAVQKLRENWGKGHVGWQTEIFESKIPGCTNVTLYYGSSAYDVAQMTRLIDNLIQDCQALNIETRSAEEIRAMLEAWNG